MITSLDCMPCFIRQSLESARLFTDDTQIHEMIVREVLALTATMDLSQPSPAVAQVIQRRLRQLTGVADPYAALKHAANTQAMALLPNLAARVEAADDKLMMAARLAIAGNIIDVAAASSYPTPAEFAKIVDDVLHHPFQGDAALFRQAVKQAKSILYLADNAGEIVFDRLLIEQLGAERVTFAVRGTAVLNDATRADAHSTGIDQLVSVVDNGSDAPGTILPTCSPEFQQRFANAPLIIAKGQGNFESLSEVAANIFFLFKVKCPVVAGMVNQPVGTQMLLHQSQVHA